MDSYAYSARRRRRARERAARLIAQLITWRSLVTCYASSADDPGTVSANLISPPSFKALGMRSRAEGAYSPFYLARPGRYVGYTKV